MTNPYDPYAEADLHEGYAAATGQPTADEDFVAELDERRGEEESPRSWRPVDPEPYLTGTREPLLPTVGGRADDRGLFYPRRIHTVSGESETGKGWLIVAQIVVELDAGNAAVVVDFEDEAGTWYDRLLAAGAKREQLRERFAYIRPEEPIGATVNRGDLGEALAQLRPTLVLLDGTTDAMTLHGLDPLSNKDVSTFARMLPRWVARQGPATVASDHLPKNAERGRYALGGVHKLNGVDGACYVLENRKPFGVGITGRSTLLLAKDRPGALRQHALPSSHGLYWYADLTMTSHAAEFVEIELAVPLRAPAAEAEFRPTVLMARVSAALAKAGVPLSGRGVEDRVKGRGTDIRKALAVLVDEKYVLAYKEGSAMLHRLVKPFEEAAT